MDGFWLPRGAGRLNRLVRRPPPHARSAFAWGRRPVHSGSVWTRLRCEGRRGCMRGYFAVGIEGVSKPMNLGNLVRIAHAFDASFFFSVAPRLKLSDANSDTSNAEGVLPFYSFDHPRDFRLPLGCRLVGVEITDEAVELPR